MQPSNGADPERGPAARVRAEGRVDAANCTDNPAARPHLSPLAAGRFVVEAGVEPIVQLTCRDRNRLGLQADLLGASALGARNVLLLTGDDVSSGDHPEAKPIFDLDSLHLLRIARILRDRGTYLSGRALSSRPDYLRGRGRESLRAARTTTGPCGSRRRWRPARSSSRPRSASTCRASGSSWPASETSACSSASSILVSVYVARSTRALRFLRDVVPGIDVPDDVMAPPRRRAAGRAGEGGIPARARDGRRSARDAGRLRRPSHLDQRAGGDPAADRGGGPAERRSRRASRGPRAPAPDS